jgi:hypothetical protein
MSRIINLSFGGLIKFITELQMVGEYVVISPAAQLTVSLGLNPESMAAAANSVPPYILQTLESR